MNALLKFAGALTAGGGIDRAPALAQTTIVAPGQSTTGTYMDYMKTVYARATLRRTAAAAADQLRQGVRS